MSPRFNEPLFLDLTSLEVEQKPAVAEVEVGVVSVLVHVLEEFWVQDLSHKHNHVQSHTRRQDLIVLSENTFYYFNQCSVEQ